MAITPSTEWKHVATPLLVRDDKVLLSSNLILFDTDLNERVLAGSDLSLTVSDVNGDTQYFLTDISIPSIQKDLNDLYHFVEDIDVTGFPDGEIELVWAAQIGEELVSHVQKINFHSPQGVTFVHGRSESESDYVFNLNTQKRLHHRFKDTLGTIVDPNSNAAQLIIYDNQNSTIVDTLAATRDSEGLYYVDVIFSDATYDSTPNKYCVYWEGQVSGGGYVESIGSRVTVAINPEAVRYIADDLTYCTNQDVRMYFSSIDEFLDRGNMSIPEREMIINQRRVESHAVVSELYGSYCVNRELLKQMEAYMTIKKILLAATAFSKLPETYLDRIEEEMRSIARVVSNKNVFVTTRLI